MVLFKQMAGIDMVQVSYPGDGPALIALLGGHVPFAFNNYVQDWNKFRKTSSFDASQTIYFTYGFNNFTESKGSDYVRLPDSGSQRISGIHYFKNKTGVFVFLDGHTEILSPPIPRRRLTSTP